MSSGGLRSGEGEGERERTAVDEGAGKLRDCVSSVDPLVS